MAEQWLDFWCLTLPPSVPARTLQRWSACLSEDELARANRYHGAHRRLQAIAGRALLRHALTFRQETPPGGWSIDADLLGRPRALHADTPLDFNIAHTDGMVVCVTSSGGRVGTDVEHLDRAPQMLEVEETILSPAERRNLRALGPADAARYLVQLWTLKEAWAKATGQGLRTDFAKAEFEITKDVASEAIALSSKPDWQFRSIEKPSGHLVSLAWTDAGPTPPRLQNAAVLMGLAPHPRDGP